MAALKTKNRVGRPSKKIVPHVTNGHDPILQTPACIAPISQIGPLHHYVMLHSGVGKFKRGDVVDSDVLSDLNYDVDHLISVQAMRIANEVECKKKHVDLASKEMHLSYESMIADKDKEIARLQSRVSTLEEQLAASGRQSDPVPQQTFNQAALIEGKDRITIQLQGEIQNLQAQLAVAQKRTNIHKIGRAHV